MANTSYITRNVENFVRRELQNQYGMEFTKQELELKTGGTKKFGAVSEDQTIAAEILAASGLSSYKKVYYEKINAAIAAIYFLSLTKAAKRFVILTDPEFYDALLLKLEGKIIDGVELRLIPLPISMERKIRKLKAEASLEAQFPYF
jgi:hypothetical protein